jgi:DNA-binding NarL/FixJ family response regulator
VPATCVILVTMHANPEYLLEALKAGAAGFVLKDISQRDLLKAVHGVLRGESILNPEVVARLLQRLASETPTQEEAPGGGSPRASAKCCTCSARVRPTGRLHAS